MGTTVAEPAEDGAMVVEVTRNGRDRERVRIETDLTEEGTGCAWSTPTTESSYPELGRSRTSVEVASDGTFFESRGEGVGGFLSSLFRNDHITISGTGDGTEAWADVVVRVPTGRTVTMHLAAGSVRVINVSGNVTVRTANGRVVADGVDGVLAIRASSGSIVASNITGDVRLSASPGRVSLNRARGGRLSASASPAVASTAL